MVRLVVGCVIVGFSWVPAYSDASPGEVDRVSRLLIETSLGANALADYVALPESLRAAFLDSVWSLHRPLFHKYYVRPQLGERRYSVSDSFFERGSLLPFDQYRSEFPSPDTTDVRLSTELAEHVVEMTPQDPVALTALGYLYLEADRLKEAETAFVSALKVDRRMAEARNGRGLAVLRQGKRTRLAIKLLEEAVATDRDYVAALFNLAMAHLGEESVDMHFHFDKVIRKFPKHHDAHHKLGAFYEVMRYFEESASAYRAQIEVNPNHWRAVIGLSRSVSELIRAKRPHPEIGPIAEAVERDPRRFLPYLGEIQMALGDFEDAGGTYDRYLALLPADTLALYTALSLVGERSELDLLKNLEGEAHTVFVRRFWARRDPLPTQEVNPRYLEHLRRVHYAVDHYSEGRQPWDRRGEVYIRFGHPEHRSWSDHLVFETDKDVVRVKNGLNTAMQGIGIDHEASTSWDYDVTNWRDVGVHDGMEREVRGHPAFPVHFGKWESWIYPYVGGGIELAFTDELGIYDFDFAPPPNRRWEAFAPQLILERVRSRTPSVYRHDYGGDPLGLHLVTAGFRSVEEGAETLTAYTGVSLEDLSWSTREDRFCSTVEMELAAFDSTMTRVFYDLYDADVCVDDSTVASGALWVDAQAMRLAPGTHTVAVQARDSESARIQATRYEIVVEDYGMPELKLSDPVIASDVRDTVRPGPFTREGVDAIALPSRIFKDDDPVYLYYEVYGLRRDSFGRTKFRIDYVLTGSDRQGESSVLRGISSLLGVDRTGRTVTFSYEHTGSTEAEPIYLAFEGLRFGKRSTVELEIRVTDLVHPEYPNSLRVTDFAVGE